MVPRKDSGVTPRIFNDLNNYVINYFIGLIELKCENLIVN